MNPLRRAAMNVPASARMRSWSRRSAARLIAVGAARQLRVVALGHRVGDRQLARGDAAAAAQVHPPALLADGLPVDRAHEVPPAGLAVHEAVGAEWTVRRRRRGRMTAPVSSARPRRRTGAATPLAVRWTVPPGWRCVFEVRRSETVRGVLVERLMEIEVSALCDADKGLPVVDPAIRAMVPDVRIAGPALTVVAEDDHLPVFSALAEAEAGDVLVIVTGGRRLAVAGELFATEARRRGVAGIVIDGFCRDVHGLRRLGLPVFARGTIPMSGSTVSRAPLRRPVRCGGVDVQPGDVVFADDDGIVIAPDERLEAALEHGRGDRPRRAGDPRGAGSRRAPPRPHELRRARRRARPRRAELPRLPHRSLSSRGGRATGHAELNAILAAAPPGVLSLMGGFPNPADVPGRRARRAGRRAATRRPRRREPSTATTATTSSPGSAAAMCSMAASSATTR